MKKMKFVFVHLSISLACSVVQAQGLSGLIFGDKPNQQNASARLQDALAKRAGGIDAARSKSEASAPVRLIKPLEDGTQQQMDYEDKLVTEECQKVSRMDPKKLINLTLDDYAPDVVKSDGTVIRGGRAFAMAQITGSVEEFEGKPRVRLVSSPYRNGEPFIDKYGTASRSSIDGESVYQMTRGLYMVELCKVWPATRYVKIEAYDEGFPSNPMTVDGRLVRFGGSIVFRAR